MTRDRLTFSANEINAIYKQTPGLNGRIHLDNAGASFMAEPVINAVRAAFDKEVKFGGYVAQEQQAEALENAYHALTRLLGGNVTDFAFVANAVDGWTKAFYSLSFTRGDNIVTAYNEYCANYMAYLQRAKTDGIEIRVAHPLPEGGIDLQHLETLIDTKTRLISISHMPSSSGEVIQAAAVGRIAQAAGILYQLDACQSAGHIAIDVNDIGCDIMTGTSRKFLRGPRGIGFLYVNAKARAQMEPVVLTNQAAEWVSKEAYRLRDDTRIFETWERSVVNQIGFGAAIEYLLAIGADKAFNGIRANAHYLREKLATVDGVTITCPASAQSAIITFNVDGFTPVEVKRYMEGKGIAVQVAQQAHTRLDYEARSIEAAVRVSPHYYTPHNAMDTFLTTLNDMYHGR